ncbi:hypothetical protein Phum_PHUM127450 [Pediculus humanus corporis]|uniref:Uncharacterized protein n=1 Tax=Pediculus humanus subsp. corporis TaxID=121224 RepID=E0VE08_PEDHC|nr:uncharacterized protein Phum_PHUM127450 [Pediculus humanus corporis]EEB11614.1 hypothetical protein Phum_PHUM127450 [Pediculus humanus corporis]
MDTCLCVCVCVCIYIYLYIADDHSTFERTSHFYERGTSTPGTPLPTPGTRSEVDGYLRRSSVYHTPPDPLRGRPRDRSYRNGPPYTSGTERSRIYLL